MGLLGAAETDGLWFSFSLTSPNSFLWLLFFFLISEIKTYILNFIVYVWNLNTVYLGMPYREIYLCTYQTWTSCKLSTWNVDYRRDSYPLISATTSNWTLKFLVIPQIRIIVSCGWTKGFLKNNTLLNQVWSSQVYFNTCLFVISPMVSSGHLLWEGRRRRWVIFAKSSLSSSSSFHKFNHQV